MVISKKNSDWNIYNIQLSYGELMAFYEMTKHENGAIADEMRSNLEYYFRKLPEPGVDEKDVKKEREAKEKADKETEEADKEDSDGLPSPDGEPDMDAEPDARPKSGPPEAPGAQEDLPSPTA